MEGGEPSRYLGLDYGDAAIGVAVSSGRVATGVETIRRTESTAFKPVIARLRELIARYGITHVVLGNPVHMDGSPSARSEMTRDFAARLQRNFKRLRIELWDERLSTQAVARVFSGKGRACYEAQVDEMAAVYILQGFLDNKNQRENGMDEKILMYDDEGNASEFEFLAKKEKDGVIYFLAVDSDSYEDESEAAEVVHFKCVADDDDDMTLEVVDEDHGDFEMVLQLFKDEYETLEIETEE